MNASSSVCRDDLGPYLQKRWSELADHPLVGEARIVGLIGALELVRDKATRACFSDPGEVGTLCRDLCIENGLVMRAVRDTMIIAPPLVITHAQIDELIEKARKSLDMTLAELRRQASAAADGFAARDRGIAGRAIMLRYAIHREVRYARAHSDARRHRTINCTGRSLPQ